MSNENVGANNSVPMDAVEQIVDERVEQRLSDLGIEIKSDSESPGLEDIWVAGQPVGKILESTRKEVREMDTGNENPASSGESSGSSEDGSLPIQQVTKIWKVGGNIRANKTEHAAAIWSDFFERSKNGRDVYYLPTDKVEQILREHFRKDEQHLGVTETIERSTVHRAMDAMEELAGNLVSSDIIRNGRRALMINQQEFADFAEAIGATTDVTPKNASSVTGSG